MKILAVISPQCGRALELASSLGELVILAVAADDAVFAGLPLPVTVEKYRVWDEALDSSKLHPVDFEARLAAVVAQAARRLGTAVVVMTESQTGLLGAALAEQLNLAHVSEVLSAKIVGTSDDDALLHVRRRGLRGVQVLCGSPQAVLSVLPPMPSVESPASTSSETTPVVPWSLSEISLSAADLPPPQVRVVGKSDRRHRPRLFIGAEALVERLRRDGLE
jgi:electron transfer flavoprotein alpha/beta subunit